MLQYVFLAIFGIVVALYLFAPKMKNRGHSNPRAQRLTEAKSSMAFMTDDQARAEEYEHRFSGTRTGMLHDRSGYRVRKGRKQDYHGP
ncbi:hypothetical protein EU528_08845 [Candidatus Thorarchaeota archaeon]|nr:MAG: hypothetical protein EU528_08845 [Candidatus Thorarchaeota archaeon]